MPKIFGVEHLLYLLVVIFLMVVVYYTIIRRVKTEEAADRVIRIIGFVLFLSILWNRLSICITDHTWDFLPGTFCGATSLALSIFTMTLKKDSPVFHSVAYTGLLGGLITLIYPDFIGQSDSIFYAKTISGLVHHTVMVFLVLMMLRLGFLKPKLKKWHYLPLGLSLYMVYGLFLITALGYGDAMYIYHPALEGTIFNWLGLGIIFLLLHFVFLSTWEWLEKKHHVSVAKAFDS